MSSTVRKSLDPAVAKFFDDAIQRASTEKQPRWLFSSVEQKRSEQLAWILRDGSTRDAFPTQAMLAHLPAHEQCRLYVVSIAEKYGRKSLTGALMHQNFADALR